MNLLDKKRNLDDHKGAYTPTFPYFEENRMVHAAYGQAIARHIVGTGAKSALSLGIGHREVACAILPTLSTGQLKRYLLVDGAVGIIEDFAHANSPMPAGMELLHGYFETFEYAARFDVIEAGFVLEHVDDPSLVLRRLHQFLAPEGRIFITVPNARSLHRIFGHSAGFLPDIYTLSPADVALGHQRYFDLASLTALVQDTGFQIAKVQGMLLKPFTTRQLQQLGLPESVWQAMMEVATDYPEISNSIYMEVVE